MCIYIIFLLLKTHFKMRPYYQLIQVVKSTHSGSHGNSGGREHPQWERAARRGSAHDVVKALPVGAASE